MNTVPWIGVGIGIAGIIGVAVVMMAMGLSSRRKTPPLTDAERKKIREDVHDDSDVELAERLLKRLRDNKRARGKRR